MIQVNLLAGYIEPAAPPLLLRNLILIAGVWLLVMGGVASVLFLR